MTKSQRVEDDPVNEIIFLIEDAAEGGFTARALGESIFTEADTIDDLRQNIREAVECHFEAGTGPTIINDLFGP
jgi:predicted RNase H-like HicB family nuclease